MTNTKNKYIYFWLLILSILWVINAFYLSYEAYEITKTISQPSFTSILQGWFIKNTFCDINETFSCSSFMSMPDSKIFWISFPYIAAIVYPILTILSLLALRTRNLMFVKIIFIMWLMWIWFNSIVISREFAVWVFCPMCLLCTGYIISITALSFILLKKEWSLKKEIKSEADNENNKELL